MDKDLRKLLKAIEDAGYVVVPTKGRHFAVYTAADNPEDREWLTTFAGTPSDFRSHLNSLRPLKRRGFLWPPRR
jgi:hypothetical protein